jgi:hypothetical protein
MRTYTCLLDLDLCAQFGQDTNDLLNISQQKGMPAEYLLSLMTNLLNPSMLTAMQKLAHLNPRIVIYTMKGTLIEYCLFDHGFLADGEAYIPSKMTSDEFIKKYRPRNSDIQLGIERVFIAREAIQIALDLPDAPEVIITRIKKDVQRACESCLNPVSDPDLAYLWDDNTTISGNYHVITIPEYSKIPEYLVSKIHSQLEEMFPQRQLDTQGDSHLLNLLGQSEGKYSSYDSATGYISVKQTAERLTPWMLPHNWTSKQ